MALAGARIDRLVVVKNREGKTVILDFGILLGDSDLTESRLCGTIIADATLCALFDSGKRGQFLNALKRYLEPILVSEYAAWVRDREMRLPPPEVFTGAELEKKVGNLDLKGD